MKLLPVHSKILLVIVLMQGLMVWGQGPKMRRVCRSGPDNTLVYFPTTDTCAGYKKYSVWGRNGNTGPYELIDSVINVMDESYTHKGANPVGTTTNWSYFLVYTDSCSKNGIFSDTMRVDDTPPDTIFLDSVSVDIFLNKAMLGWRMNRTPDFYRYLVYRDSMGLRWVEVSRGIFRDTFIIDESEFSDPRIQPLRYDITSTDSCNTRAQVFNINPHMTMRLLCFPDTCRKTALLQWNHYVGWPKIRRYYIFQNFNGEGYELIDSISGEYNDYETPIMLGNTYEFFVRAYKDAKEPISSTSSTKKIFTSQRLDPENTRLINVTAVDPDKNELKVEGTLFTGEAASSVNILYNTSINRTDALKFASVDTKAGDGAFSVELPSPNKRDALHFTLQSIDLCNKAFNNATVMPQLVISVKDIGGANSLSWNKHFGWNTGISGYNIFRGTNNDMGVREYFFLASVSRDDTTYTDTNPPELFGSMGLCYYVEAVQDRPQPAIAKSFSNCLIGEMTIFMPNAFRPEGVNKFFRPEGAYIDYANSTMEIYDRWGGLVESKKDITSGWDGKDASGRPCQGGVYFYKFEIMGFYGSKETKTGFVTLLN